MIYFFHGTDVDTVRTKAFEWVAAARGKEANLAYIRLAREDLTPAALEEITFSGGLFIKRLLVVLDNPFPQSRTSQTEDEHESEEEAVVQGIENELESLAASNNAIVVLAPKLHAAKVKKIVAHATKTYTFNLAVASAPVRGFNTALVNALSARNKENLWLEINRALIAGDAPEMVHGLLHWKARDILGKGSRSWSFSETRKLSMELIEVLQASRRSGGFALNKGLEKFALTI